MPGIPIKCSKNITRRVRHPCPTWGMADLESPSFTIEHMAMAVLVYKAEIQFLEGWKPKFSTEYSALVRRLY